MSLGKLFRELVDLPLEPHECDPIVMVDPHQHAYKSGFRDGAARCFEVVEENGATLDELVDWIDGDLTGWANSDEDGPPPQPGR